MEKNFREIGEKLWNSEKTMSEWSRKLLGNCTSNLGVYRKEFLPCDQQEEHVSCPASLRVSICNYLN